MAEGSTPPTGVGPDGSAGGATHATTEDPGGVQADREGRVRDRLCELGAGDSDADDAFLAGLLRSFLRRAPREVAELRDLVAAGEGRAVEQAAHKLKGAALNLGVQRLSVICGDLEAGGRHGSLDGCAELVRAADDEVRVMAPIVAAFVTELDGSMT